MSRDALPPPEPNVWQAQYLRCISFPVQPQHAVAQNWWHELTGTDRESRVEKKREIEEEGTVEGVALSLSIDLLRVQWTVAPRISAENAPDGFPVLGPFLQWRDWFRNLLQRWFALSPPVRRLAFAGVVLQPVATRDEGYGLLDRYLRWLDVDPQSSDLLYRINRRVPSRTGVPDLGINRLMTWSVGRFEVLLRTQLLGEAGQPEAGQVERTERHACVLELDINTVPEPRDRILPQDALPAIFDELLELGTEIAARGDQRP
jgi:hypothetical protein